jgi:hypothetical protein
LVVSPDDQLRQEVDACFGWFRSMLLLVCHAGRLAWQIIRLAGLLASDPLRLRVTPSPPRGFDTGGRQTSGFLPASSLTAIFLLVSKEPRSTWTIRLSAGCRHASAGPRHGQRHRGLRVLCHMVDLVLGHRPES